MPRLPTTLLALLLTSCASFPARYEPPGAAGTPPPIAVESDRASMTLDVLTYNVEGLQWPARSGRAPDLQRIGQMLREMREHGRAPDIILFQEAFSAAAIRAIKDSGYPFMVGGPGRTLSSVENADARRVGRPRPTKGEIGLRLLGSGLVIASRYPVTGAEMDAYSRKTCAGFDCLSNKGVQLVRLAIPGVPVPIEVAATHMNSQRASKVRVERHLAAHQFQSEELARFLERHHHPASPLILGGDFNMRRSQERFTAFRSRIAFDQVHEYCAPPERCDVRLSWDGDAPWMDTQDLQFFAPGKGVEIRPERVEAMFDGSPASPKLSDHDGFRVQYRLSWKAD
ncbi:endonuclease/exonuclease/phosphatase family protein [Novosphingobium soli]|uniref:Endonuclease/exonuclease/phosphatase family protein n=1 Tax=Novosphingobium soli TaxID=574956 RepID=A0ABV6CZM6_9SPHN